MGFRVVNQSSLSSNFQTDLQPSARDTLPSGILHAFRSATPATFASGDGDDDSLKIEYALRHLEETRVFDRAEGIIDFVPYPTKQNRLIRHPRADPRGTT